MKGDTMKLTMWVELEPGESYQDIVATNGHCEVQVSVPAKYVVCERCCGSGSQDVFGNGVPSEYFDEDPDFGEDYRKGVYNKACEECGGLRVVPVPDREAADPESLKLYDRGQQAEWDYLAEVAAEQRFFQRAAEGMARW